MRVRQDKAHGPGPWPSEPLGTIAGYADTSGQIFREVDTVSGRERLYWVVFDTPQLDTDGDGPYASAEILESYLKRTRR